MKLDRILLTTDLSDESLRAFQPLAELARGQQSAVTLLHVVEDAQIVPHGAPFAGPISLPGVEADQKRAEAWLAEHAPKELNGLSVDVQVIRAVGAGHAIADYAREHDIDLIAMATHGRTGFRALILGSVAASVLRHADCPVLVFPRTA